LGKEVRRGRSQNNFAGGAPAGVRPRVDQSIKDAEENIIKEAPLPIWANFQQRALDVAVKEINAKTDLKIKLASIERSKQRRVVALGFAIKTQAIPKRRPNR
jgi:hypothetical protein